ncbi:guanine nucleotide-binding protein subunit beta-like protein 1 [Daktulosphaira vitifoliae]|uniref:guanine nucleotide-binding protein subunit beta-like protein 1 n=1 Tax=Daktulosphaira vitifoliae TaxID=58002 RepID=UPI0021A9A845|nr:guanine nucleotide-binding protein subunit beta-like protein 1 [Daktulosphaira vitifoliae]
MFKTIPAPVYTYKCDEYIPNCLLFDSINQLLYTGTQTGEILTWNLETNRQKSKTKAGKQCILKLELLTTKNLLISQNKLGEIQFWLINKYNLSNIHTITTQVIGFCKFVLYDNDLILCKSDKEKYVMNFFSIHNYEKVKTFNPNDSTLGDLMVIKCVKNYIFCAYESCKIIIWLEDKIDETAEFPDVECLMALDIDSNITKGVCAGSSDTIYSFQVINNKICLKKSIKITNPGISELCLRSDNKLIAAVCWDFNVRIFSWKTMKLLALLDSHSNGVLDVTFSKSLITFWKTEYLLAIACKDCKITLWNIYNDKSNIITNKII